MTSEEARSHPSNAPLVWVLRLLAARTWWARGGCSEHRAWRRSGEHRRLGVCLRGCLALSPKLESESQHFWALRTWKEPSRGTLGPIQKWHSAVSVCFSTFLGVRDLRAAKPRCSGDC